MVSKGARVKCADSKPLRDETSPGEVLPKGLCHSPKLYFYLPAKQGWAFSKEDGWTFGRGKSLAVDGKSKSLWSLLQRLRGMKENSARIYRAATASCGCSKGSISQEWSRTSFLLQIFSESRFSAQKKGINNLKIYNLNILNLFFIYI